MSDKKEYKVGEIFRHDGFTYQCVVDSKENGYCRTCQLCDAEILCDNEERSDKMSVHFIRVTEPKEGMLFRATSGVLYELKKRGSTARDCGCSICLPADLPCLEIDIQAFGEPKINHLHWYPVEEPKEEETMEKKRHLELAVVKVEGDQVTFRIAEQTHRGDEFCENGEKFKSRCGVILNSQSSPDLNRDRTILFVRGIDSCMDDKEMTVSLFNFARIMEAVTEYNETDGWGYEKLWPQKGDKYFYISSAGAICDTNYDDVSVDNCLREFGNFFRTREEAEAALERVKKALKGES